MVPEIVGLGNETIPMVEVTSNGTAQFLLISRVSGTTQQWGPPSLQMFHELMNRVRCKIITDDLDLNVVHWATAWGGVGLIGLDTSDRSKMHDFRSMIAGASLGGHVFNTFPRDLLLAAKELTLLLKEEMAGFQLQCVPKELFDRTSELHGTLQVTASYDYEDGEKTTLGVSKRGWRLVELVGDSIFLDALRVFSSSHYFPLGTTSVKIRGGNRASASSFHSHQNAFMLMHSFAQPKRSTLATAGITSSSSLCPKPQKGNKKKKKIVTPYAKKTLRSTSTPLRK